MVQRGSQFGMNFLKNTLSAFSLKKDATYNPLSCILTTFMVNNIDTTRFISEVPFRTR